MKTLPQTSSGIVIVGAGLAGLFTALKLSPLPVTIIAAATIGKGASSAWAQGGIAAAIAEGDTTTNHARDTIDAGAGIVNEDMAHLMANEAPACIKGLLSYGVPFDRDLAGRLSFSREAAHSHHRIVRVKGDMAGHKIMQALIATVRNTASITLIEGYAAHKLITERGNIIGLEAHDVSNKKATATIMIPAWAVVLASGGIGGLYKITTNPLEARGNGLAMAACAGAVIADAEFMQFHPTGIAGDTDPSPLATEALRGDGAILVNNSGERFMKRVHESGELAPRDIVARAVFSEIAAGRNAYLECRKNPGKKFKTKFPKVYSYCRAAGINPETDLIPVVPSAHYHMGGVLCDAVGRSTVNGLWVCGEVASTGAHGANRLASNSLLEACVFASRIAVDITAIAPRLIQTAPQEILPSQPFRQGHHDQATLRKIRALMSQHAGVVRNRSGLIKALKELKTLEGKITKPAQIANILLAAKITVVAALAREESRGAHFRSDFPQTEEHLRHRSFFTLEQINKVSQHYLCNDL